MDIHQDEDMSAAFADQSHRHESRLESSDMNRLSNEVRFILRNPSDTLTMNIMQILVSANADYQVERGFERK